MEHTYKTNGTCSSQITFELDGTTIHNVKFTAGCNGNLKGIAALVEGKDANEVIPAIRGIKCGFKNTSCPDQLALALEQALNS